MEDTARNKRDVSPTPSPSHRRASSNSSLLSKFSFLRTSQENRQSQEDQEENTVEDNAPAAAPRSSQRPSASIIQYQKTRRRRGSLRKVALLGRGAQRERRDSRALMVDTAHAAAYGLDSTPIQTESPSRIEALDLNATSDDAPRTSIEGFTPLPNTLGSLTAPPRTGTISQATAHTVSQVDRDGSSYTSTDEEDILQIPRSSAALRQGLTMSPNTESYFGSLGSTLSQQRRRSIHQAKSPLSYGGLSTNTLPAHEDWNYADTEWWGWVVLCVTWFVFVIGMGSCFDVWSWAWDVGKTPYAPPELEDDPTLPIVGYYPALIILTGVMAWVWVVVAWVGMKYFRHAKISGD
ncbi:hypothetical protein FZEAL_1004 [Fusarium zealandicum]|uniref:Uncharacterized protein n=1 Tax=Fusarium zealandicum TaxID=1053134 RepID=A0A8H4XPW9_9HYPO|nr:hypothetical protein FZEAL_1004 [Fusarium zealandicum]